MPKKTFRGLGKASSNTGSDFDGGHSRVSKHTSSKLVEVAKNLFFTHN